MPLPWVFVFFLIFITFFMVTLYVSSVSGDAPVGQLKVKPGSLLLLW